VRDILLKAKNPVLLCSFGKESLVLLKMIMDIRPIPILHFYDELDPFVEKIIREWELDVMSYAPAIRYRVKDTVVSEYAIGNARLPMLRDVSENGKPVGYVTTPQFHYDFDYTFFGYRKTDSHPLVKKVFEREFQLGPTRMVAPLYDLSDRDVFNLIDEYSIPYQPYCDDVKPGNLPALPVETFQERFGFN